MHAKFYLTLFYTCACLSAFPQIAEWSTPQKPKIKTAYVRILGYNEEGYFLHRSASKNFSKKPFIEYYRTSLGLEYTQPLPNVLKKANVEKILLWGNYLYSFYSRHDAKTGKTELSVQKFDVELNPKGPIVKVTDEATGYDGSPPDFRIVYSRDKSRVWCFHSGSPVRGKLKLSYTLLSDQMLPLFSRACEITITEPDFNITDLQADDNGNLFLLASSSLPDKETGNVKTKYTLIRCNTEQNIASAIKVDSAENRISNAEMAINYLNHELVLTGIYSEPTNRLNQGGSVPVGDKSTAATGYVFCRFSIDSFGVNSCTFNKFDKTFVAENIGEIAAEKGKELSDLVIRRLIPRSDAGVIMIAENFYITQQSYSYVNNGIPQTQVKNQFNYDNIMLISINPDGSTEWKHVIKKNQVALSDEDYYSSFVTMVTPDSIHILFNEKTTGGDVLHYSIHNTGSIDHEILFKSINSYVFLMPREARQISNNVVMLATIKDRKFCLLKIIF